MTLTEFRGGWELRLYVVRFWCFRVALVLICGVVIPWIVIWLNSHAGVGASAGLMIQAKDDAWPQATPTVGDRLGTRAVNMPTIGGDDGPHIHYPTRSAPRTSLQATQLESQ